MIRSQSLISQGLFVRPEIPGIEHLASSENGFNAAFFFGEELCRVRSRTLRDWIGLGPLCLSAASLSILLGTNHTVSDLLPLTSPELN